MKNGIFLGLGSNLGDRMGYLKAAIAGLQAADCKLVQASGVYETPPWGLVEQPAFLNAVLEIQTQLEPMQLLQLVLAVEADLGRRRVQHWGPRQIDIDILAHGQQLLVSQALQVPHPLLQERAFVLVPWAEIASDFGVPALGKSVGQLLEVLSREARGEIVRVAGLE